MGLKEIVIIVGVVILWATIGADGAAVLHFIRMCVVYAFLFILMLPVWAFLIKSFKG